jgi:hypothetical protein
MAYACNHRDRYYARYRYALTIYYLQLLLLLSKLLLTSLLGPRSLAR